MTAPQDVVVGEVDAVRPQASDLRSGLAIHVLLVQGSVS
jgi:hypothetical protein